METSATDPLLKVSLYIRGDQLDVDATSKSIGLFPTKAMHKGTPKLKDRATPVYATTTVVFSRKSSNMNVSSEIIELFAQFREDVRPATLPGVDEAFVDIFLARPVDEGDLGSSIEWTLSRDAIDTLSRFGVSAQISMCNVNE